MYAIRSYYEVPPHLGGVDARGDEDDHLSLGHQSGTLTLCAQPRVGQLPLDLLVAGQIRDVRGVADEGGKERAPERGLAVV